MTGGAEEQHAARVDAYVHLGLPRFQSLEDLDSSMAANGIERAVVVAFDSSPDLGMLREAAGETTRFRAVGVPLGDSLPEQLRWVERQLDAGFSGIRVTDEDVQLRPELASLALDRGCRVIVCGAFDDGLARAVREMLGTHADGVVIGGHFAAPSALAGTELLALLDDPRFHVIMSRQGAFPAPFIGDWARQVHARVGASRLMWGSEAPVLYWRGEDVRSAASWFDGLALDPDERRQLFGGTADRVFFGDPVAEISSDAMTDAAGLARARPAQFLMNGLPIDQALAGRLVHAWTVSGGSMRFTDFLTELWASGLEQTERTDG